MMLALAGSRELPCVLIPGGVTLQASDGEDAGKVQSAGARFAQAGQMTLQDAADACCAAPALRPAADANFWERRQPRR